MHLDVAKDLPKIGQLISGSHKAICLSRVFSHVSSLLQTGDCVVGGGFLSLIRLPFALGSGAGSMRDFPPTGGVDAWVALFRACH